MFTRFLKVLLPVMVILLALASSYALVITRPIAERVPSPESATQIRAITVQPERIQLIVQSQGSAMPRTQSNLVPEVSGRVVWISPSLVNGGYFQAEETLLRIDDSDYLNSLERRKAAFKRSRAEHQHAVFEFKRLQKLVENRLASQSQLESSLRNARISEAGLREAEMALEQAERDLARTELKAPFIGLVSSEQVDPGQFVSRGQSVATLYATDTVEVRLPLADSQLAYLDIPLGQLGELPEESRPTVNLQTFYRGESYSWLGQLVRTEAEIDSRSRMVNVIARVSNDPGTSTPLRVGLFVSAEIEGRWVDDIFVLPRAAIRNGNRVLIVDAEQRLRFRDVELLKVDQDNVLIRSGLSAGEMVNISPLQAVVDGMRVNPIQDHGA